MRSASARENPARTRLRPISADGLAFAFAFSVSQPNR